MSEPPVTHQIIGQDSRVNILHVNAHRDPHQHLLRALSYLSIDLEEVGPLQSLVAEVIVVPISLVVDRGLQLFVVCLDYLVDLGRNKSSIIT